MPYSALFLPIRESRCSYANGPSITCTQSPPSYHTYTRCSWNNRRGANHHNLHSVQPRTRQSPLGPNGRIPAMTRSPKRVQGSGSHDRMSSLYPSAPPFSSKHCVDSPAAALGHHPRVLRRRPQSPLPSAVRLVWKCGRLSIDTG